jgi:hypothetical protein
METLGYLGNGSVDQFAVPIALDVLTSTGQLPDQVGHALGNRTAFGSDLGEFAVMHPQGVHGTTHAKRVFHNQATLFSQHSKLLREMNDLVGYIPRFVGP